MNLVLDTNILGELVHPNAKVHAPVIRRVAERFAADPSISVYVPEIADYELRRELVLKRFTHSVERLNQLAQDLLYLPITTQAMRRACDLWADARRRHQSTAQYGELDGDVILAAQALSIGGTVVTKNVRDLSRYVAVEDWR